MTKQYVLLILFSFGMILLSAAPCFSQQNQNLIRGTVKSTDGMPVEGTVLGPKAE